MTLDVVALGELNPDLILQGLPGLPRPGREMLAAAMTLTLGSSTALCAANLAALGLRVGIVGRVGDDLFGQFVLAELRRRGVAVDAVIVDPDLATGITVSLAYPGDRALLTVPGAMGRLRAADVKIGALTRARHLHVSSFFLQPGLQPELPELFAAVRAHGLTVSFDPAWDPAERWAGGIEAALARVDVLFTNRSEACALARTPDWREAALRLAARAPLVVVKRGAAGASAVRGGGREDHPGFRVEATDPTGAGDAFDAGFLFGFLTGRSVQDCLRYGNACGALTAARPGGSGAFATPADVETFMARATENRGEACGAS